MRIRGFGPELAGLVGIMMLIAPVAGEARDITDMLGRKVSMPDRIESVITVGAVPVINTYVFAVRTNGITTVMLRIGTPDESKAGVHLIGEMFADDELGARYAAYFDTITARVAERVADTGLLRSGGNRRPLPCRPGRHRSCQTCAA